MGRLGHLPVFYVNSEVGNLSYQKEDFRGTQTDSGQLGTSDRRAAKGATPKHEPGDRPSVAELQVGRDPT